MLTKPQILEALIELMDPEIPTISLVDLGIITGIEINEINDVSVTLTPTFSGCPALQVMEDLVRAKVQTLKGVGKVKVETSFDIQWNSDMITDHGRQMLLKHGLAPPPKHHGYIELDILSDVACPQCGSRNTDIRSPFGPTLCRSLHYCKNCLQGFEQFKPVA